MIIVEIMGLYNITRDVAKLIWRRIGNKLYMLYVMLEEVVDINYEVDFVFVNNIVLVYCVVGLFRLRCVKLYFISVILLDTLDDMGVSGWVVFGLKL